MNIPNSGTQLQGIFMETDDGKKNLDDLDELIHYFEQELVPLKQIVEDHSRQWEFFEAKRYAREYGYIKAKLLVLRNLKDPDYERRAYLYQRLVRLEESRKKHPEATELINYYQREIDDINRELDVIESQKRFPLETQHIDDALFELVEGTIKGFIIHVNRTEGIQVDFACDGEVLSVFFRYNKGSLLKQTKRRLRGMGFAKTESKRTLVKTIDVHEFNSAQPIKQFLAVLFFDTLGRSWFGKPVELETRLL